MNPPVDTRTSRHASAGSPATARASDATLRPADATLRRRYQEYRGRQARELLALIPRDAVRPLLREARARAADAAAGLEADDPVALLTAFCEELLPLPPFDVWSRDFQRNRSAHLEAEALEERGPVAEEGPVTIALRSLEALGSTWYASLDVLPRDGRWAGYLRYHSETRPDRTFRTADVFREDDAEAVRRRFLEFDDATLLAFLRSVLP